MNKDSPIYSTQPVNIVILSNNIGGFNYSKDLNKYPKSKLNSKNYWEYPEIVKNDIIVMGFQEIVEVKSKNYKKLMFGADKDYGDLSSTLAREFTDFDLFYEDFHGPIGIYILVRKDKKELFDLQILKVHKIKLGFMGFVANKGILGVELLVNHSKFIFFNAHLTAGEKPKNFEYRKNQIKTLEELMSKIHS